MFECLHLITFSCVVVVSSGFRAIAGRQRCWQTRRLTGPSSSNRLGDARFCWEDVLIIHYISVRSPKLVSFGIANMLWCKFIRMKMFWISTTKLNSTPSSMNNARKKEKNAYFWSFCKLLNFSRIHVTIPTWSSLTVYPSLGTKRQIRTFRQYMRERLKRK